MEYDYVIYQVNSLVDALNSKKTSLTLFQFSLHGSSGMAIQFC